MVVSRGQSLKVLGPAVLKNVCVCVYLYIFFFFLLNENSRGRHENT